MDLRRRVAIAFLAGGVLAWQLAKRTARPGTSGPTPAQSPLTEFPLLEDPAQPEPGATSTAPAPRAQSTGEIAALGAGVLGLSTWTGIMIDQLLLVPVIGPAALVLVVAVGWLVPAAYCVVAVRRYKRPSRVRRTLPALAIPGILIMLHLLAFSVPTFTERINLWIWPWLLAIFGWSLFYHLYRQRSVASGAWFCILDVAGSFAAIQLVWPNAAAYAKMLVDSPDPSDKLAPFAFVLLAILATILLTSDIGVEQSILGRTGAFLAGLAIGLFILFSNQESWESVGVWRSITAGIIGCVGTLMFIGARTIHLSGGRLRVRRPSPNGLARE